MDAEQFWMSVWSLASVLLVTLVTIVSITGYHEDTLLHDLIEQGHDPMELACLFSSGDTMKTPCLILSQAKAKVLLENDNVAR